MKRRAFLGTALEEGLNSGARIRLERERDRRSSGAQPPGDTPARLQEAAFTRGGCRRAPGCRCLVAAAWRALTRSRT